MRKTYVLALVAALFSGTVFAQVSASDAAFDRFYAQVTGVGKQTVSYGSGGQLVVGQGVPQISSSGGPVNVERSIPIRNNSGGQIAANARVAIPPVALGKIIRAGVVLSPYLVAGVALYDLAKEIGFQVEKSGAEVTVYKPDPGVCTVSPCFSYTVTAGSVYGLGGSASAACNDWIAKAIAKDGNARSLIEVTETTCRWTGPAWGAAYTIPISKASVPPDTGPPPLSSLSELEAAIASNSGWPSTSKISQAVADATALQPAPAIQAVPQVTGPATSPGESKTKVNPDGSTTTTTTTHNHTYTGPTVNTTTMTVTSTCNGGSCNTTSETETPKIDDQPFAMPCGVPGTPPCAVTVDETGMKTPDQIRNDQADNTLDQWDSFVTDIIAALPAFPTINWAFSLPTACGVIPLPAFSPMIESIDVCQFQPMFHELMTVVWTLGGLFGAISLFMRSSLSN